MDPWSLRPALYSNAIAWALEQDWFQIAENLDHKGESTYQWNMFYCLWRLFEKMIRVQTILLLHYMIINFQNLKNMYFLFMLSSAWLEELVFVAHKAFLMQKENRCGGPTSSSCFLILQSRCEIPGEDRLSNVCWPSPGAQAVAHLQHLSRSAFCL